MPRAPIRPGDGRRRGIALTTGLEPANRRIDSAVPLPLGHVSIPTPASRRHRLVLLPGIEPGNLRVRRQWRKESNPRATVLEAVPLREHATRKTIPMHSNSEAARVGFPMGGSPSGDLCQSGQGVRAVQPCIKPGRGGIVPIGGRAPGDDRGALTQALRPSLPHARHDFDPSSGGVRRVCPLDADRHNGFSRSPATRPIRRPARHRATSPNDSERPAADRPGVRDRSDSETAGTDRSRLVRDRLPTDWRSHA